MLRLHRLITSNTLGEDEKEHPANIIELAARRELQDLSVEVPEGTFHFLGLTAELTFQVYGLTFELPSSGLKVQ